MMLRNRKLGSPSFKAGGNRVGEVENHSAPDFFPVEENGFSQSNSPRRIPSMMRMDDAQLDDQGDVTSLKNKIRELEEELTRAKHNNDTSQVRNIVNDQGRNGTDFNNCNSFSSDRNGFLSHDGRNGTNFNSCNSYPSDSDRNGFFSYEGRNGSNSVEGCNSQQIDRNGFYSYESRNGFSSSHNGVFPNQGRNGHLQGHIGYHQGRNGYA